MNCSSHTMNALRLNNALEVGYCVSAPKYALPLYRYRQQQKRSSTKYTMPNTGEVTITIFPDLGCYCNLFAGVFATDLPLRRDNHLKHTYSQSGTLPNPDVVVE